MLNHLSRRKFVKFTSGFAVGVTAGTVPLMNLIRANAQNSTGYQENSAQYRWMKKLPDSVKISRLTIPGTHQTCALHGAFLNIGGAICQKRTLKEQLKAGIRFLDIRCRHIENMFAIHHGQVYQKINFGEGVRDVCIAFLKANPSEFIVMSVKPEYNDEKNTRSFQDTFDWYIEGNKEFWYFDDRVPSIQEVRGKIVLLRRFAGNKGINATYWQDNATFDIEKTEGNLKIQDEYTVNSILSKDIDSKWEKIKNLLDSAKSDASNNWYINFTSGASLGAYPDAVATQINSRVYDYLVSDKFSNRLGTFAMDFPDDNLINRIINLNT